MALNNNSQDTIELMYSTIPEIEAIASCCQKSSVGKLVPDALYVHVSSLHALDSLLQKCESRARSATLQVEKATLVKFSINKPKISYLFYPDFDTDPHPALQASIQVDLQTLEVAYRDYSTTENPPILHRKETFVTPDYPLYEEFAKLTRTQEALGLLNNSSAIGTRYAWEKRLQAHGVQLQGHTLIQGESDTIIPRIERHKAAIVRNDFSRPVRLALEAGLFTPETTFFDYGCGHGSDVTRLAEKGYVSAGYDPYYFPNNPQTATDIVNIGYVINVIEDQTERRQALVNAWELTQKILIVSAQVLIDDRNRGLVAYADGIITSRNTFQKYYQQEELKTYIDQVLGVDAVPVALGIYFVFRDEAQAQSFRASRFRSRATTPRVKVQVKHFEDYQELLAPLMAFVTERGRLPEKGELTQEEEIKAEFRTIQRAFHVILQATDPQEWEAIAQKRRQDLMVYLALSQFSRRPKLGHLAPEVQEDIKALFGSYKQACVAADKTLFSVGNLSVIRKCCHNSKVGKKLPNSLWVHVSALEELDFLLRLYEGCASRTIGRLETANVIKIHTKAPKISYLYYPDFDTEPHPTLQASMEVDLRDLHVSYRDFDADDDLPILHQKEQLVLPDYPMYEKLVKLSRQEEDWGLLDDWRSISLRSGWLKCLEEHCAVLKGYQLCRQKDADPYKLKVLRAAAETRRKRRSRAKKSDICDVNSIADESESLDNSQVINSDSD